MHEGIIVLDSPFARPIRKASCNTVKSNAMLSIDSHQSKYFATKSISLPAKIICDIIWIANTIAIVGTSVCPNGIKPGTGGVQNALTLQADIQRRRKIRLKHSIVAGVVFTDNIGYQRIPTEPSGDEVKTELRVSGGERGIKDY
jgi:hypothetical protein